MSRGIHESREKQSRGEVSREVNRNCAKGGRIGTDLAEKDALEIYVDGSTIVLKKYRPSCIFCDSSRDLMVYKDKNICPKCLKELKNN